MWFMVRWLVDPSRCVCAHLAWQISVSATQHWQYGGRALGRARGLGAPEGGIGVGLCGWSAGSTRGTVNTSPWGVTRFVVLLQTDALASRGKTALLSVVHGARPDEFPDFF